MLLRLSDLSPVSSVKGYILVAFKSYFDGGNQADSTQYKVLSLAAISGTSIHWADFERRWKKVLENHGAPWLHTTDAVSLQGPFKEWDAGRVNAFISDCVTVMERCAAVRLGRKIVHSALRPVTISVVLRDFKRALQKIPLLGCPEHLCAIQAAACCLTYGKWLEYDKYQFFFDQNEPFYGHIKDRTCNRKSKRSSPTWNVVHLGESNMRDVPALQAADVLAWSVNHQSGVMREWQQRLLAIDRDQQWLDYASLVKAKPEDLEVIAAFGLPHRRPMK